MPKVGGRWSIDLYGRENTLYMTTMYGYIPHNVQHQEWTVMWTMGLGWLWYANVGSSLVINGSFWWEMLIVREATDVWGRAEGMLKICVSSSHFYCEPKAALNFFLIHWVWIKSRNNQNQKSKIIIYLIRMCEWAVLIF